MLIALQGNEFEEASREKSRARAEAAEATRALAHIETDKWLRGRGREGERERGEIDRHGV